MSTGIRGIRPAFSSVSLRRRTTWRTIGLFCWKKVSPFVRRQDVVLELLSDEMSRRGSGRKAGPSRTVLSGRSIAFLTWPKMTSASFAGGRGLRNHSQASRSLVDVHLAGDHRDRLGVIPPGTECVAEHEVDALAQDFQQVPKVGDVGLDGRRSAEKDVLGARAPPPS